MLIWSLAHIFLLFQWIIGCSLVLTISAYMANFFGAMWVPSSLPTIRKLLTLAQITPGQRFIDLGAGDGRVVIMVARQFQAQAIGVEIDPFRCLFANGMIMWLGLRQRAWVYYADVFEFDLTGADVVFIYLTKATNQRLKPSLMAQLRPGVKVITRFAIPDWTPLLLDDIAMLFVYEIGHTGADVETKLL